MKDYTNYNDTELITLLAKGDDRAFREIYNRYNQLLYIFAFRKLKDDKEAQDVVHDVFAWLLERGQQLELKTSLSSYLYKAVLHKIFDIFRKQNTFQRYINEGKHYIDLESQETDFLIREKQVTELIEKEISAMPPRMREVYELKYKHYLNNEQIGTKLNISPQTVKTHLKHANRHLKNRLGLVTYILYLFIR